jgi:hypothetical protein
MEPCHLKRSLVGLLEGEGRRRGAEAGLAAETALAAPVREEDEEERDRAEDGRLVDVSGRALALNEWP